MLESHETAQEVLVSSPTGPSQAYLADAGLSQLGFAAESGRSKELTIKLAGRNFHLTTWGHHDAPPLLLLHGAGLSSQCFHQVAPDLSANYYVIAFDQRGTGANREGTSAAKRVKVHRLKRYVRDVGEVVDLLGLGPHCVAGHSLAGLQALAYAAWRPAQVKGVVLIDVLPYIDERRLEPYRRVLSQRFNSLNDVLAHFIPPACLPERRSRLVKRLRQDYRRDRDGQWRYWADASLLTHLSMKTFTECQKLVGKVSAPILVLHAEKSRIVRPDFLQLFRQKLPASTPCQEVEIHGAGHLVMEDNPAEFVAELKRFLSNLPTLVAPLGS